MLVPFSDPNDLLRQRLDSRLLVELLGPPVEGNGLYDLQESQSPTQTNLNYAQALRVVNQVKNQERKK